ncbi:ribosomal 5S rRNA E-loop binding protein Ctc/L25/TL5 [Gottschalkia purinilytica]|uniref:Large ribosomal subunit protein bL25 n=1 Tax=Gottschalkia purinilytica TaxID=1503 RepID=A0A0L0W7I6_GOTPU|nr:50S ribosomal protein L25 [Gottschalkia purinilytica]KNF07508.1 ribosomal 5S rRNA E-loop binding protein Ctc/L25/TL5 [Gottschalkia purinilytica]
MNQSMMSCAMRSEVGSRQSNRTRNRGFIPAILYGRNFSNYPIEIDSKELSNIVRDYGENALVSLSIEGNMYTAMIKDIQRDAFEKDIIHIDLQQVDSTEKIQTSVPVLLTGKEYTVSSGIIQQQMDKLDVECYPNEIPKFVSVDVSQLGIGESIRVSDVEIGEELTVLNGREDVIASLSSGKMESAEKYSDEITPEDIPKEIEGK